MKHHILRMAGAAILFVASSAGAEVEGEAKGKNVAELTEAKPKGSAPKSRGLQLLETARHLVAYGMEKEDAYALVTAARMLKEANPGKLEAKRKEKARASKAKASKSDFPTDVPAILAKAEQFAQGDESVLAAIQSIRSTAGAKGPTTGPDSACYKIRPKYVDVFNIRMRGQEPYEVAIAGRGTSDLDLYVFDNNGNLVGVDNRPGIDQGYVRGTPIYTATFQIEVRNEGSRYNTYCIVVR